MSEAPWRPSLRHWSSCSSQIGIRHCDIPSTSSPMIQVAPLPLSRFISPVTNNISYCLSHGRWEPTRAIRTGQFGPATCVWSSSASRPTDDVATSPFLHGVHRPFWRINGRQAVTKIHCFAIRQRIMSDDAKWKQLSALTARQSLQQSRGKTTRKNNAVTNDVGRNVAEVCTRRRRRQRKAEKIISGDIDHGRHISIQLPSEQPVSKWVAS